MADPFLGQISTTAFDFAPRGWALCHGQLIPINQNQALFALLGTQFGGDGRTTFALPDLRGRAPLHRSAAVFVGETLGQQAVSLRAEELPLHSHSLSACSDFANSALPAGALPAARPRAGPVAYAATGSTPAVSLHAASVAATGGSQPHNNMQPSLGLNFIIALQGIFPSRD